MYKLPLMILAFCAMSFSVHAADAPSRTQVIKVKNEIYMLVSPHGGNVVVSTGDDGVFLIDDQLTPRSKVIHDAIRSLTDKKISFILNTHFHFDHSGGNEFFGEKGAIIVAHDNVRKRLSSEQFISYFKKKMPPLSKIGLPVVTFSQDVTFHYNNDSVHIIHVPLAHTDGDAFAHFVEQNVIVAGDLIFNEMYPFIDAEHGGSVKGIISALGKVIELSDNETLIIPGHGKLMVLNDVRSYQEALSTIVERVEALIGKGKTLDQIIAKKPTKGFDAARVSGFIKPDAFVKLIYEDLSR